MEKVAENRKSELFSINRMVNTEKMYSKAEGIDANKSISQWWSNHHKYVVDWQLESDD